MQKKKKKRSKLTGNTTKNRTMQHGSEYKIKMLLWKTGIIRILT